MSETTNTETTTDEQTPTPPAPEAPQGAPDTDWKEQARKWETRAKADHDAANKWREYEASQKTEHEKLAEELARAKDEALAASAELTRLKVAASKGITGEAIKLLKGSTPEELEAEADLLLSLIAEQSKPKGPKPDELQGKPAPSSLGQLSQADLKSMSAMEVMKAKSEGRLDALLGKN
jgi:superfamily II RNA helicase